MREELREAFLDRGAVFEAYALAQEIIIRTLGFPWWKENISSSTSKQEPHFRIHPSNQQESYEHQDRIMDFADSLFILQSCEGFEWKIKELRKKVSTNNRDVFVEDTIIELRVAKMLVKSGHAVKFVRPSRSKTKDFDLEINLREGNVLCAEVKCKREDTAISTNNLRRTLYRAEKQLPKTASNVIFVRLPTTWVQDPQYTVEIDQVLIKFFDNVRHINAVVIIWEECIQLDKSPSKARILKYQPKLHPSPLISCHGLDKLFTRLELVPPIEGNYLPLSFIT